MSESTSNHSDDPIFVEEQGHLDATFAKLTQIRDDLTEALNVRHKNAAQDLKDMSEEVTRDFSGADETMETLAAIETLNAVIDSYNQAHDIDAERLSKVLLLLHQPYFAKVRLTYPKTHKTKDVYIGTVGITDNHYKPLVIDWRAPIAQTYYNQQMGPCSYEVDGRTIQVDLKLRRQFDITENRLNNYFDTSVAIQDSLLLQALRHNHSTKLQAITATIQREQNQVVRHEDVPVLLVNGIAGSGKTSVLLQRIAYLLYQQRDRLDPSQVYLFTPNDIFKSYIDTVLPSMGEKNPQTYTWSEFFDSVGLKDRAKGEDTDPSEFPRMEQGVSTLELEPDDFREIRVNGTLLLKSSQLKGSWDKFPRAAIGPRRCSLAKEELHERLDRRLASMAKDEEVQDQLLSLDLDDQLRILGEMIDLDPSDHKGVLEYTKRYLQALYGEAHEQIEKASWLDIDHIGRRILGKDNLNGIEWLYLYLLLTGGHARDAHYVMIDEVQDYTVAQLMLLSRYFESAHFLLLGDEHQAIREGTASFGQIRQIFSSAYGNVEECRLLTSYRSSPEITALFSSLMSKDERTTLSSVQREGVMPTVKACPQDKDSYLAALQGYVDEALREAARARERGENLLCAVIAADKARANWLRKQLGPDVLALHKGSGLPANGVVVLDLALAKGLEFDQVIIPDAQAEVYGNDDLSRRRLYTAISRAMHQVTVLSQGQMTELLS